MLSETAAFLAFNELDQALTNAPRRSIGSDLPEKSPLFVTWTLNGDLRGCIGTFQALPTESAIRKYALIAAFEDHRFDPINTTEFKNLAVSVTLLGKPEPTKDLLDWEIGVHGVIAVFPNGETSTFLPEVAKEQNWTKEETLQMLAQKANVSSVKGVRIMKYEGHKSKLDYKQYKSL